MFPSVAERIVCPKCEKVFVNPSFEAVPTTTTTSTTSTTPPTTPTTTTTTTQPLGEAPTEAPALPAEEEEGETAKEAVVEETKTEVKVSESESEGGSAKGREE